MKLPKLTSIFLNMTNDCCLACKYCYMVQHPNYMTYQVAQDTADWLYQNWLVQGGKLGINYFGGEPLMCYDTIIRPLTLYIRDKYKDAPFNLSITTNGILLTEDKMQFLKEHDIGLLLSIDGIKEVQDGQRPCRSSASSFDILEPKLDKILEYFPNTTFRSTTTPAYIHKMIDGMLYAESKGFSSWFVTPNMFEVWDDKAREEMQHQIHLLGDYFIEKCRAGQRPIHFSGIYDRFKDIQKINAAVSRQERRGSQCQSCSRCGVGGGQFGGVDPFGRVFACQDMDTFNNGDNPFFIGSIYDGLDDDRRLALINSYTERHCSGGDCSSCKYDSICDGGCVSMNYMATGDLRKIPEVMCFWNQRLLDEAIRIMNTLGEEENPVFQRIWREANG